VEITVIAGQYLGNSPRMNRIPAGNVPSVSRTRPLYSIGAVAGMLGSSAATLRSWEERYGVVEPERTKGGRRLYRQEDVERLRFVTDKIKLGFSAADAHRLLRAQLETGGPPRTLLAPARTKPQRVLLAESDPYGADLSEHILRSAGYVVDRAGSAADAERAFRERPPELTIVELLISGGAGTSLCATLKQLAPLPVLAISSLDGREQALAAGADEFLQKPLAQLRLVSAVKRLTGRGALAGDGAR
jgi:DNA-binding transcriptional MerR regulator